MSIRWDEEEDQPDTQVVSSDDLLLPASDPARRSSDMSSTLVAAPDNLSGFGGPNHVPDPYPTVPGAGRAALAAEHIDPPRWQGFLMVHVHDPRRVRASGAVAASSSAAIVDELPVAAAAANGGMVNGAGAKDAFVSYGIRTETNLAHFDHTRVSTRRRYRDFAFLHDALQRDLPACLVPPLPDKHRMEYVTGDRFSTEFVQRRTYDLQIFLERVCRHPALMRTPILRSFLESNEWVRRYLPFCCCFCFCFCSWRWLAFFSDDVCGRRLICTLTCQHRIKRSICQPRVTQIGPQASSTTGPT